MSLQLTRSIKISCKPVTPFPSIDAESLDSFIRLSLVRVQNSLTELFANGIGQGTFLYNGLGKAEDQSLTIAWEIGFEDAS